MKLLLISDIHGSREKLQKILVSERYDMIVFCGDGLNDLRAAKLPEAVPVVSVLGNCDRASGYQGELYDELSIEQCKVFVVHGDIYNVKQTLDRIVAASLGREADVVFFGHTHLACKIEREGMLLVNPGAVRDGAYALCEIIDVKTAVTLKKMP